MSAIREVCFSLREVEGYIRAFEEKYKMSSADFLGSSDASTKVSEDDAFEWQAFIAQRQELRLLDRETYRGYLSTLKRHPHKVRRATDFEQVYVAA